MDMQRRNLLRGKLFSSLDEVNDIQLPWLTSVNQFFDCCTRCNKCLQACPENIIETTEGGYPTVNFKRGECIFCAACADICPEALFTKQQDQKPWAYVAVLDSSCLALNCVSCRSCQDSCQYGALNFKLKLGVTPYPQIDLESCTGCGACVSPCPKFSIKITINPSLNETKECIND